MRYFVPKFELGVLAPAQTKLEEKFGGLPWGLPADRWPNCGDCGMPQSFLGQFAHHEKRLDLGAPGRMLFVFQCNHDPGVCETWTGGSGANACLVLSARERVPALTKMPTPAPLIETEVRIVGWTEEDDGLSPDLATAFFDDAMLEEIPEDERDLVPMITKFGGPPAWVQSAEEGPKPPWRFAFQLEATHRFHGKAPHADDVGCTVTRLANGKHVAEEPKERRPGAPPWLAVDASGYTCGAGIYGDGGFAYVFVNPTEAKCEGWFFWQC